jgi:hypothetical protein
MSNFVRKDRIGKCTASIEQPASVELYNNHMGDFDKSDMMLALQTQKMHSDAKWTAGREKQCLYAETANIYLCVTVT